MTHGPGRIEPKSAALQPGLLQDEDVAVLRLTGRVIKAIAAAFEASPMAVEGLLARTRRTALAPGGGGPPEVRAARLALELLAPALVGGPGQLAGALDTATREVARALATPRVAAAGVRARLAADMGPERLELAALRCAAPGAEVGDDVLAQDSVWAAEVEQWLADPPPHARGPDFERKQARWQEAWHQLLELARGNQEKLLFPEDPQQRAAVYRQVGKRLSELWRARAGEPQPGAAPSRADSLHGTEEMVLDLIEDMVPWCLTGWTERISQLERLTPTVSAAAAGGPLEGARVARDFRRSIVAESSAPILAQRAGLEADQAIGVHVKAAARAACNELFALGYQPQELTEEYYTLPFEEILDDARRAEEVLWRPAALRVPALLELAQLRFRAMPQLAKEEVFEVLLDRYQEAVQADPGIRLEHDEAETLAALQGALEAVNRRPFELKDPEARRRALEPLLRDLQTRFGLRTGIVVDPEARLEQDLARVDSIISSRLAMVKRRFTKGGAPPRGRELAQLLRADLATRTLSEDPAEHAELQQRVDRELARLEALDTPAGMEASDAELQQRVHGLLREWSFVEARFQRAVLAQLLLDEKGLTTFGAAVWMALVGAVSLSGGGEGITPFLRWVAAERLTVLQRALGPVWGKLFDPAIQQAILDRPALLRALEEEGVSQEALLRLQVADLTLGGPRALLLENLALHTQWDAEELDQQAGALMLALLEEQVITLDQLIVQGATFKERICWTLTHWRSLLSAFGDIIDVGEILGLPEEGFRALELVMQQPGIRDFFDVMPVLRGSGPDATLPPLFQRSALRGLFRDLVQLTPAGVEALGQLLVDDFFKELVTRGLISVTALASMPPSQVAVAEHLAPELRRHVISGRMALGDALRYQAGDPDRILRVLALPAVAAVKEARRLQAILTAWERLDEPARQRLVERLRAPDTEPILQFGQPALLLERLAHLSDAAFDELSQVLGDQEVAGPFLEVLALPEAGSQELERAFSLHIRDFLLWMVRLPYPFASRLLLSCAERPALLLQLLQLPESDYPRVADLARSGLWRHIDAGVLPLERALPLTPDEEQALLELLDHDVLYHIVVNAIRSQENVGTLHGLLNPNVPGLMRELAALPASEQRRLLDLLTDQTLVPFWMQAVPHPFELLQIEPRAMEALRRLLSGPEGALLLHNLSLQEVCLRSDAATLERLCQRFESADQPAVGQALWLEVVDPVDVVEMGDLPFRRLADRLAHPAIQSLVSEVEDEGRRDPFLRDLPGLSDEQFEELIKRLHLPEDRAYLARSSLTLEEFLAGG